MRLSRLLSYLLKPFMMFAVETDEDGNVIGTENDKRLAMYNKIADNNDKGRSEEFYEVDEEGNTTGLSLDAIGDDGILGVVEEEVTGGEESEEEEVSSEQKTKQPLTSEPRKYKITVNGVEKEVSEDWLIETAQKVDSADDYLREAARLNESTKSLQKSPSQEGETHTEELDDVTLARHIQMGSEEEAAAAIRKLRSPSLSKDDLDRTVDERLTFQKAVDWFQSEYKDIVSDPVLSAIATQQDNILRSQGDKRPYVERYKDIGEGIRNWMKSKVPTETKADEPSPETKVDVPVDKKTRKSAAPSVPKPAFTKVEEPVEEEEEESIQDTIANMAKSRGGPQWMRN